MTSFHGCHYGGRGSHGGYSVGCSAPKASIAAPIGISVPMLQAPVLRQPVMQQPAMHHPSSMMQHPMQTFNFKFTASRDAHEHGHEEADALCTQGPSPRNSIEAAGTDNEGMQETKVPVIKQARDQLENENALCDRTAVVTGHQFEMPETVDASMARTEDLQVTDMREDNIALRVHDTHIEVAAECHFEISDPPDAESICNVTKVEEARERGDDRYGTMVEEARERGDDRCGTMVEEAPERVKDNDGSSHVGCVPAAAETQEVCELMDIDHKCNSVVGTNGDYRSGMARQAVAYLLKNSMPGKKADAQVTNSRKGSIHTAENSTVASSTVTSRAASTCPSQRSEKQEEEILQPDNAIPAPPTIIEKPQVELREDDAWASSHFEAIENDSQSLEAATASGDDCRSYVSSIICPPVVSPTAPITSGGAQMKDLCEDKTGVDTSVSEDVCPKGHELRWHAWQCASCDKRGYGLRFGCAECHEANLCVACRKRPKEEPKTDAAAPTCKMQPLSCTALAEEGTVPENRPKKKDDSNRNKKPVDPACKSVLSMQAKGSSTAAQLLGGLVQQQDSKTQTSSRIRGESKSVIGAAGAAQRRSGQRGSASVLCVKNTSTSAAAGVLGPLLEQKAK